MKVIRKNHCRDCGHTWKTIVTKGHPIEDCPNCLNTQQPIGFDPKGKPPAYKGLSAASKAVDYTYRMAEQDYGMTDMNDMMRNGDIAAKMPVSKEMDSIVQQQGGIFNHQPNVQKAIAQRGTNIGMASTAKAERMAMGLPDAMSAAMPIIKSDPGPIARARRNPIAR